MQNYFINKLRIVSYITIDLPTVATDNAVSSSSEVGISINIPPSVFEGFSGTTNLLFTVFESSVLLPLSTQSHPSIAVASSVVGTTIAGHMIENTDDNITVTMKLHSDVSRIYYKYVHSASISRY